MCSITCILSTGEACEICLEVCDLPPADSTDARVIEKNKTKIGKFFKKRTCFLYINLASFQKQSKQYTIFKIQKDNCYKYTLYHKEHSTINKNMLTSAKIKEEALGGIKKFHFEVCISFSILTPPSAISVPQSHDPTTIIYAQALIFHHTIVISDETQNNEDGCHTKLKVNYIWIRRDYHIFIRGLEGFSQLQYASNLKGILGL